MIINLVCIYSNTGVSSSMEQQSNNIHFFSMENWQSRFFFIRHMVTGWWDNPWESWTGVDIHERIHKKPPRYFHNNTVLLVKATYCGRSSKYYYFIYCTYVLVHIFWFLLIIPYTNDNSISLDSESMDSYEHKLYLEVIC